MSVVWFVNQYAGSPRHGMEFRHFELGRELMALGHTVVVISGAFSHLYTDPPRTRGTYTLERLEGITYCWVRVPRYGRSTSAGRLVNMLAFAARLSRLPVRRLPAPDTIVVSSPSPAPILPAERWARRFHARLVFEVRDLWGPTLRELGGLPAWHPVVLGVGWLERHACRVSDAVVTALPAAAPYLVAAGADPATIRVVPNGIGRDDLAVADVGPGAARDATAGDPFRVGFVGTLGDANALEALVGAARLLAGEPVRFELVGHGSAEARLRAIAADLPNVSFRGAVPKRDVPALLRAYDACYVGYHRTPLYRFGISPNKVFDYMAAGRPIVLAASAANDPVAEAACGLTVPPDDPEALAAAIRRLRDMDPEARARLGANGRAFVEREHAYPALARRYQEVLGA